MFFGESISQSVKEASFNIIDTCDRLLVIGSSLQVYSAFRLIKKAKEQGKKVAIVNIGPTRADSLLNLNGSESQNLEADLRLDMATKEVIQGVLQNLNL